MNKLKEIFQKLTMAHSLLLGLALAGLYYAIFYDPGTSQLAAIAASKARIGELQEKINADQKKLDRAAEFKKKAAEAGSTINKLLATIPEKFSMPDLMRIVSNEAKVAGSSLVNITPNGTNLSSFAKEFDELSVSIELNGTFLQHMVFLSNLTKIKQILIIRKFDFNVVKEGRTDEPTTTKMVAEIVAFRYRGEDKSAVNGATQPPGTDNK